MKKILASFRRLAALPMHVHALVFGAFFISGSLSMSIPYLSFRVAETGNASSLVTGIVLASSAFVWSIVGFWTGGLSDRFGRRTLILTAMALSAAAYAGLGFASSIPAFLLLNASVGFAKALFDPSWQALLAEVTKPEDKPLVFSFRYLASNAGFAIGPIVSFWFQSANPASVFFVTAGVYVAFGIVLAKVLPAPKIISTARTIATRNDSRLSTLASNRSLLVHVVAGAAIAFVFSQIQSTLPLHLNRIIPNAVALYSLLLSVRGIATITLQLLLLICLRRFRQIARDAMTKYCR